MHEDRDQERFNITRRKFLRGAAAAAGVVTAGAYIKPTVKGVKLPTALAVSPLPSPSPSGSAPPSPSPSASPSPSPSGSPTPSPSMSPSPSASPSPSPSPGGSPSPSPSASPSPSPSPSTSPSPSPGNACSLSLSADATCSNGSITGSVCVTNDSDDGGSCKIKGVTVYVEEKPKKGGFGSCGEPNNSVVTLTGTTGGNNPLVVGTTIPGPQGATTCFTLSISDSHIKPKNKYKVHIVVQYGEHHNFPGGRDTQTCLTVEC